MKPQAPSSEPPKVEFQGPPEQWQLKWNPRATVDWPEKYIGGCRIGENSWLEPRPGLIGALVYDGPTAKVWPTIRRSIVKVLAITVCSAVLFLCLPGPETLDFWIVFAAFVVALIAATL